MLPPPIGLWNCRRRPPDKPGSLVYSGAMSQPVESLEIQSFLPEARPSAAQQCRAAAGLLLLLILVRFAAFRYFNTRYLGGFERDAGLYVWLVNANIQDLFGSGWFNTPAFYPYTRTLAWSDNFILPSLAVWVLRAGLSVFAAYNVVLLGACFLNGFVTYRLCYRLTSRAVPSWTAGAAFMASSALTAQLGHPQLQFAFWIPAALYYLIAYLSAPRLRAALQLGFVLVLCFLCTVYYAVLIPPLIAVVLVAFFLLRPGHLPLRGYGLLLLGSILGAAPAAFFVLPYFDVRNTFGGRGLYESFAFGATALSYVSAAPLNWLYGRSATLSHGEAHLFPGVAVLGLAATAFWRLRGARRQRRVTALVLVTLALTLVCSALSAPPVAEQVAWLGRNVRTLRYLTAAASWAALLCGAAFLYRLGALERELRFEAMSNRGLIAVFLFTAYVFFALSLGPLGKGWIFPQHGELFAGEFAPGLFTLFYGLVPGADSLRAVSRIGIVVILCLTLTIPFALVLLARARGWGRGFYLLIAGGILAEIVHWAIPFEGVPATPPVFQSAAALAAPGDTLLVLPFAPRTTPTGTVASWSDFALLNVLYMNWALPTGLPVVNGYSGQRSKLMLEYPGKTARFPDLRSLNALSLISGLRYIIYLPEYDARFDPEDFSERLKQLGAFLTLKERDAAGHYLFEYLPQVQLAPEFVLRVPSYPRGTIALDLMSLYRDGAPETQVEVLLKGAAPEGKPLQTFAVPSDGKWHTFEVTLPATADRVRPLLLTLKAPPAAQVFLGRNRFIANQRARRRSLPPAATHE